MTQEPDRWRQRGESLREISLVYGVTTVAILSPVLLGLLGHWAFGLWDKSQRLGFLLGFLLGLVVGVWEVWQTLRRVKKKDGKGPGSGEAK